MLNVMNYKVYEEYARSLFHGKVRRSPLQLTRYHLMKWGKIERKISSLYGAELETAKVLYATLKHLTEEERLFLAEKYRHVIFMKPSLPDKDMAEKNDMNINDYRELRKGIEFKFFSYMAEYLPFIKNNMNQDLKLSIEELDILTQRDPANDLSD